jgi:hypothetical protein
MILWERIETFLHGTPPALRSTRFGDLEKRGAFVHGEVVDKAKAVLGKRR